MKALINRVKIQDLNKNMMISNEVKMISKWRSDELFISSYIEKGFKVMSILTINELLENFRL